MFDVKYLQKHKFNAFVPSSVKSTPAGSARGPVLADDVIVNVR